MDMDVTKNVIMHTFYHTVRVKAKVSYNTKHERYLSNLNLLYNMHPTINTKQRR
jgi:hypothetical protein